MNSDFLTIILISLIAGMGTGLGGLIAVVTRPSRKLFGFLMGITAGVMISLAFLELVNEAWQMAGYLTATIGFGLGAGFMLAIDYFAPHIRFGELEMREVDCAEKTAALGVGKGMGIGLRDGRGWGRRHHLGLRYRRDRKVDPALIKSGLLIAAGIAIHNLPEGFAVGAGFSLSKEFGFFIAVAILLHNIPEGMATALPLCEGGMLRRDALRAAILSGLVEPLGALLAAGFLEVFDGLLPGALAFAGGVMVFITLDELIPAAREHGHHHMTAIGIILGALFVFILSGLFGV
jgi:ZIP family zinc transporter